MSKTEEDKFQELCLCPEEIRSWFDHVKVDGLEALQSRLEEAVGQVKATTMVSRNKKEICGARRDQRDGSVSSSMQDPVRRKVLRKKAQKAPQPGSHSSMSKSRWANPLKQCCPRRNFKSLPTSRLRPAHTVPPSNS